MLLVIMGGQHDGVFPPRSRFHMTRTCIVFRGKQTPLLLLKS